MSEETLARFIAEMENAGLDLDHAAAPEASLGLIRPGRPHARRCPRGRARRPRIDLGYTLGYALLVVHHR
jgi:hypothetical protein